MVAPAISAELFCDDAQCAAVPAALTMRPRRSYPRDPWPLPDDPRLRRRDGDPAVRPHADGRRRLRLARGLGGPAPGPHSPFRWVGPTRWRSSGREAARVGHPALKACAQAALAYAHGRPAGSTRHRSGRAPHLPRPLRSAICRRGDRRRTSASPTWSGPEGSSHNGSRFGLSFGLHPAPLPAELRRAGTFPLNSGPSHFRGTLPTR